MKSLAFHLLFFARQHIPKNEECPDAISTGAIMKKFIYDVMKIITVLPN